jgi:HSP20 family protein
MSFFKKLKNEIDFDDKNEIVEEVEKKENKKSPKKKTEKKLASTQKIKEESEDWMKADGQLAIDVYQTKSSFVIQAPVAGIKPEDLGISVENDFLIIKGKREKTEEIQEKDYFYQECYWGSFSRKVSLPEDLDSSKIKASLKKGILTVKIPIIAKKLKKIVIQEEEE